MEPGHTDFGTARAQAEVALAGLRSESAPSFPTTSGFIRAARARLGLREQEVVELVGPNAHVCPDLELRDDEAFTCAAIHDLVALSKALSTSVCELLLGAAAPDSLEPVACDEVAGRLRQRIEASSTSAAALGEAIGWDIEPVLQKPVALAGYNVVGLRDICSAAGLDWLGVVVHLERSDRRTRG